MRTLVWFRGKDLRLADHAPLAAALEGGEVILLFVVDPYFFAPTAAAQAPHRMQFLCESLAHLHGSIAARGSTLLLAAGKSTVVVPRLAELWQVDRVVGHRWSEPVGRQRDRRVAAAMRVPLELFEGETLVPPGSLRTGAGTPFAVFTPFSRAFAAMAPLAPPLAAPQRLPRPPAGIAMPADLQTTLPSTTSLGLRPNPHLTPGGEGQGMTRLEHFLGGPAATYADGRNRMDLPGTSRLSQDLKFGTVSVRQVWHAVARGLGKSRRADAEAAARAFRGEILWREFALHTLWDRPAVLDGPFRAAFARFPWRHRSDGDEAEATFAAFATGRTGYPIVDAAARQLLQEGFVHNRARMIAASFLCKHLLFSYRDGEAHYLRWLTDGDWAANNLGWQWSAGCGCDAQPYFRVFNPTTQGEKFDPQGDYVRRFVPELARLPPKFIHAPERAPAAVLRDAGLRLGADYPLPIVEHAAARGRFLALARDALQP